MSEKENSESFCAIIVARETTSFLFQCMGHLCYFESGLQKDNFTAGHWGMKSAINEISVLIVNKEGLV